MADGGERPPKRARKNIDMVVESEGASGNSEDGPVSGSFARSRVGPSQNSESSEDRDEPEDRGDLQRLLGAEPPLPEHPTAAATEMIAVARKNAPGLRDWLLAQAKKSASCACTQPRPRWSKDHPQATSTCGHENAGEVASISMKQVLKRQKKRGRGDDVAYVLARTVRSCIQYNAAEKLGCCGRGNQCRRGICMARAMDMFCGQGMEGIPLEVVRALCRF